MTRAIVAAAALIVCVSSFACYGQETGLTAEVIGDQRRGSGPGAGSLVEDFDHQTGGVTFRQTDITAQGAGPDIVIARSFIPRFRWGASAYEQIQWSTAKQFADWEFEIPRIEVRVPTAEYPTGGFPDSSYKPKVIGRWEADGLNKGARCSAFDKIPPVRTANGTAVVAPLDWWTGAAIALPDGYKGKLLFNAGLVQPGITESSAPFKLLTVEGWRIGCLQNLRNSSDGEGFLAVSPEGTKYWFDWLVFDDMNVMFTISDGGAKSRHVRTVRASLYATRVEDRFGNWISYSYDGRKMTSIVASDGRELTLGWSEHPWVEFNKVDAGPIPYVRSITLQTKSDRPKVWSYEYELEPEGLWRRDGHLRKVRLPDGSFWMLDFDRVVNAATHIRSGGYERAWDFTLPMFASVKSPGGALTTYTWEWYRARRYRTEDMIFLDWLYDPDLFDTLRLVKKEVVGPGFDPLVWRYTMEGASGNPPGFPVVKQTITHPDGSKDEHRVNNEWRHDLEGKITHTRRLTSNGSTLRSESYDYKAFGTAAYPAKFGDSFQGHVNIRRLEGVFPLHRSTVLQDSALFRYEVSEFDTLARPAATLHYSENAGPNQRKVRRVTYHDDHALWALGGLRTETVNGIESVRVDYGIRALPWKEYRFGKLQKILGYNLNGTLAYSRDGNGSATEFLDWKLGKAQLVRYPNGTSKRLVIDEFGLVKRTMDEERAATCLEYDELGRVSKIQYPSTKTPGECDSGDSLDASSTTNAANIRFELIGVEEFGIGPGHWRRTESVGNYRRVLHYDGLWRPAVEQEYDLADVSGTQRFRRYSYDHAGRVIYSSYPGPSASASAGSSTKYDAIGRPTSISQDSELGPLSTTFSYLPGFLRTTTTPNHQVTTEQFQAFDEPLYELPTLIDSPEGVRTLIGRDIFGKPMQVTREPRG